VLRQLHQGGGGADEPAQGFHCRVGQYICGDLACSLYIRGKISTGAVVDESLDLPARIARLEAGVDAFIGRVMNGAS
jgi:hypothetical protein